MAEESSVHAIAMCAKEDDNNGVNSKEVEMENPCIGQDDREEPAIVREESFNAVILEDVAERDSSFVNGENPLKENQENQYPMEEKENGNSGVKEVAEGPFEDSKRPNENSENNFEQNGGKHDEGPGKDLEENLDMANEGLGILKDSDVLTNESKMHSEVVTTEASVSVVQSDPEAVSVEATFPSIPVEVSMETSVAIDGASTDVSMDKDKQATEIGNTEPVSGESHLGNTDEETKAVQITNETKILDNNDSKELGKEDADVNNKLPEPRKEHTDGDNELEKREGHVSTDSVKIEDDMSKVEGDINQIAKTNGEEENFFKQEKESNLDGAEIDSVKDVSGNEVSEKPTQENSAKNLENVNEDSLPVANEDSLPPPNEDSLPPEVDTVEVLPHWHAKPSLHVTIVGGSACEEVRLSFAILSFRLFSFLMLN
eukprot:TRINITY_DN2383_c0_g1_i2.p1 TRINITY_DN2383_c0_g1~~TRINITY_DN2383_c0_g1_i2.p1  ORF type:complete len:430 (+),score=112.58 TRINITY_DN2383_c0_g1_i2:219-1508(+)